MNLTLEADHVCIKLNTCTKFNNIHVLFAVQIKVVKATSL